VKRFTETQKWDDSWFMRLSPLRKLFWMYICDRCDASGVLDFIPELAALHIGTEVTETWLNDLGTRVQKLPNGKWQIIKFLPFQYGKIDANCPAHRPIIRLIQANDLKIGDRVPITLSNRVSDKVQEKEKDKEREYPISKSRPKNQTEVETFCISIGLQPSDGEAMWLRWQSQGFGKTRDWKATIRQWKIQGYHPSQKQSQPPPHPKQPAPIYDKLPPTREVPDDEFLKHQRIAKEAAEKFRAEQQARLRSA
jgi:hypothetical protein